MTCMKSRWGANGYRHSSRLDTDPHRPSYVVPVGGRGGARGYGVTSSLIISLAMCLFTNVAFTTPSLLEWKILFIKRTIHAQCVCLVPGSTRSVICSAGRNGSKWKLKKESYVGDHNWDLDFCPESVVPKVYHISICEIIRIYRLAKFNWYLGWFWKEDRARLASRLCAPYQRFSENSPNETRNTG